MGRVPFDLLLLNGQWFAEYIFVENAKYKSTSAEWTLLDIDLTERDYGTQFVYDEGNRHNCSQYVIF